MTETVSYPWVSGDKLLDRNSYMYTPSVGAPLIEAWLNSRQQILAKLPPPKPLPEENAAQAPGSSPPYITRNVVRWLRCAGATSALGEESIWIDRLLRKFETTKRLHSSYDGSMRALDKNDFDNLDNYLLFADILLVRVPLSADVIYLNCLLKLIDSLCSVSDQLSENQKAHLAHLITGEKAIISDQFGSL